MNRRNIFNGANFRKEKVELLKQKIRNLDEKPKLGIIFVGKNPESEVYVSHKTNLAKSLGIDIQLYRHSNPTEEEVIEQIERFNEDQSVNGILVQLPLPLHIDKTKIFEAINPLKDVDGFNSINKGLLDSQEEYFIPATARAVIEVLKHWQVNLESKRILLIGYSDVLGKPLSKYLLNKNATLMIVNEYSVNWKEDIKSMDVVISAVGKENIFAVSDIKFGSIVIGVGTKKIQDEIVGDYNHEAISSRAKYVTPTPNGIGPLTVYYLFENVVNAYELQKK